MCRLVQAIMLLVPVFAYGGEDQSSSAPLWDGIETVAQYARRANLPPAKSLELGKGVKLDLVLIPAGKFVMGTPQPKPESPWIGGNLLGLAGMGLLALVAQLLMRPVPRQRRPLFSGPWLLGVVLALGLAGYGGFRCWHALQAVHSSSDESPAHEVTIGQPFYMGKYEVTVRQFARFVEAAQYQTEAEKEGYSLVQEGQQWVKVNGRNWRKPGFEQGAEHPVCEVSWNDAQAFCEWANSVEQSSGLLRHTVRLPTEAQWEYAARAGTRTAYPWGDDPDKGKGWGNAADLTAAQKLKWSPVFNWDDGYVFTAPVGQFRANAFDLYDTMGNVAEWCEDCYGEYAEGAATDPT
ncbi:MAG: SUMF1/EgtB/PvdO family nonheme iron enzyme, partial [Planctomycetota bacterium]